MASRCLPGAHAGNAERMSDHVYKSIEITGSSPDGVTQAIDRAVTKASQSLRGLDWFEVTEIRGHIEGGSVGHYQVTLKVGFRLED
jgi:flavin-binding protein dodecin